MCVIKRVTSTLQTVKAKENTRWKNCPRLKESVQIRRLNVCGTLGGLLRQSERHQWDKQQIQMKSVLGGLLRQSERHQWDKQQIQMKSVFLLVVLYQNSWRRQWHPLQYSCLENPMDGGAW